MKKLLGILLSLCALNSFAQETVWHSKGKPLTEEELKIFKPLNDVFCRYSLYNQLYKCTKSRDVKEECISMINEIRNTLINKNIDANIKTEKGVSLLRGEANLLCSVETDHWYDETFKLLIVAGANIKTEDWWRQTPIDVLSDKLKHNVDLLNSNPIINLLKKWADYSEEYNKIKDELPVLLKQKVQERGKVIADQFIPEIAGIVSGYQAYSFEDFIAIMHPQMLNEFYKDFACVLEPIKGIDSLAVSSGK